MSRTLSGKQLRAFLTAVASASCVTSCVASLAQAQEPAQDFAPPPGPPTPQLRNDDPTPVDYLQVNADSAQTFMDGAAQVVLIDNPITIQTDRATLSAKAAVIWFTPVEGGAIGRQRAEIALIGEANLTQNDATRSGDSLFVSTVVGGPVRLCVRSRENADLRQSDLYKAAGRVRPTMLRGSDVTDNILVAQPDLNQPPSTQVATATTEPATLTPTVFSGASIQTTTNTPDGKIAVVIRGSVLLTRRQPDGDLVELQADQAVLFTNLTDFAKAGNVATVQDAVQSAYLEGDVRINFTPSIKAGRQIGEQRLRAKRAYYVFATNQAVLTEVVLQSTDPRLPFPITMRANVVKQLSLNEYDTQHVTLTTSQFASPSYAINASKAYVRSYQDPDPLVGPRVTFQGTNATLSTFGVPVFYLPYAGGDIAQNAFPLKSISLGSSRGTGFGVKTTWGLYESVGLIPPEGLDAQYHVDYYSDRGAGLGFDTEYKLGQLAETTKGPWNGEGKFTVYALPSDSGFDNLGRYRAGVDYDGAFRGRLQWEHQQILPDNWQSQTRVGLVTDPTFMEEWYESQFRDGNSTDLSEYAKHQDGNEALTLLVQYQPNGVVTNADDLENRFITDRGRAGNPEGSLGDKPFVVDRLPELGYFRLGESFDDDNLTLLSENRVGGYRMNESFATYGPEYDGDDQNYGFRITPANAARGRTSNRIATPGIPSLGYTGQSEDWTGRADFREEVDYPIDAGRFKVVPYVMGRYTGYTDSPDDDPQSRVLGGVGARVNTSFWKIDDSAENDFFDIHRVRHVVEPELNLFASAASIDRDDVYIYDDTIDGISDVSAASFFIRQRWQTKRGAPGLYRSVDYFTLNAGITGFANTPEEPRDPDREYLRSNGEYYEDKLGPDSAKAFRGVFFQATPEASIPRSNISGDASWRLADTTLLLGDANWNIEEQELATTAAGLLVGRGDRVSYYTGLRYIGSINSMIASFSTQYQLTPKYSVNFSAAIDLARQTKGGTFNIIRHFDRFYAGVGVYYDQTENESGFNIIFYPEGFGAAVNSGQLSQFQGTK